MAGLTAKQYPYTGPYGLKSSGLPHNGPTVESLSIAMWRLGHLAGPTGQEWTAKLGAALAKWDPGQTGYGPGRWEKIRRARVPKGLPHAGELALDDYAVKLVHDEFSSRTPPLIYPHPVGTPGRYGGIHPTGGLLGYAALDFMAPGGTVVFAIYPGTIRKVSGRDPSYGVRLGDRFGYSIYLERADGVDSFQTHFGSKLVRVGQKVEVGQPIGTVGHWPHDPGRSHTHIGVNAGSWMRSVDFVENVAHAPRIPAT